MLHHLSGVNVLGCAVELDTKCAHYHSELDVIAIKFPCCGEFYSCFECHQLLADHSPLRWGKDDLDAPAILCGCCGMILSIKEYLGCDSVCPSCKIKFNPACALHYPLYFTEGCLAMTTENLV